MNTTITEIGNVVRKEEVDNIEDRNANDDEYADTDSVDDDAIVTLQ